MALFPSGPRAKKTLSARLTDIPRQKLRLLQQLAERELAQERRDRYWAKRLLPIFGLAIALYLGALLISLVLPS
jgi:hypothetical protein